MAGFSPLASGFLVRQPAMRRRWAVLARCRRPACWAARSSVGVVMPVSRRPGRPRRPWPALSYVAGTRRRLCHSPGRSPTCPSVPGAWIRPPTCPPCGRRLTAFHRPRYVLRHAANHTPHDAGSCRPQACVLRRVSPGLREPLRAGAPTGVPARRFTPARPYRSSPSATHDLEGTRGTSPARTPPRPSRIIDSPAPYGCCAGRAAGPPYLRGRRRAQCDPRPRPGRA